MVTMQENLSAIGKAQVDTALRFAQIAAQGIEKITELNLKAAKAAFADNVRSAKSMSEIKDAADFPAWATSAAQPGFEKATVYAKSVYEAVTATGSELGSLLDSQVTEFNKQVVVALDSALKSAPAGSEATVAAVKSVIGIANSVYDNMAKASKQLAAITDANITAASEQAGVVTKKKSA